MLAGLVKSNILSVFVKWMKLIWCPRKAGCELSNGRTITIINNGVNDYTVQELGCSSKVRNRGCFCGLKPASLMGEESPGRASLGREGESPSSGTALMLPDAALRNLL